MSDERHTCMHAKWQTPVFLIVSIDNLPKQKTFKYSYKSLSLCFSLSVPEYRKLVASMGMCDRWLAISDI